MCGCSIKLVDSYKEFWIEERENYDIQDYMESDELEHIRVDNVALVPEIKEINHNEFIIYLGAYSKDDSKEVVVNSVKLCKDDGSVLYFIEDEENKILYESRIEGQYYGTGNLGSFTVENVSSNEKMTLIMQVQVSDNKEFYTKSIEYSITIKGHRSFVFPT